MASATGDEEGVDERLMQRFLAADHGRACGDEDWNRPRLPELPEAESDKLRHMVDCLALLDAASHGSGHSDQTITAPGRPQTALQDGFVVDSDTPDTHSEYAGYQIDRLLGQGGFGLVYKATDGQLGRSVAIKVPLPSVISNEMSRERFELEARASAVLQHPNIVIVHETMSDAQPGIVYEFCNGGTLADFVQRHSNALTESQMIEIAICIAQALRHAHAHGVLHRDLKPSNILLMNHGSEPCASGVCVAGQWWVPKLCDFGLAKLLDEKSDLTQANMVIGSVDFMAPEQAAGKSREAGTYTDIFAFGAVLYWMITGKPPFKADSRAVTLTHIETKDPVPPRKLRPNLSRNLESVCLKCLQKTPAARYENVSTLIDDLLATHRGEPVSIRPASVLQQLRMWCRRHRVLAVSMTLVFLLGVVAIVLLQLHNQTQQNWIARLDRTNTRLEQVVQREGQARKQIRQSRSRAKHRHHISELRSIGELLGMGRTHEAGERLDQHQSTKFGNKQQDFASRLLEASCNKTLQILTEHQAAVLSSALNKERTLLVTGDKQGSILVRNTINGRVIRTPQPFPGEVCDLAFSANGTVLAASGTGDSIWLYDTQTWKIVQRLKKHNGTVTSIVFTPDGRQMISGSRDHHVAFWNTDTWTVQQRVRAHDTVQDISLSGDGRFLATGGDDGRAKVWDVASGELLSDFPAGDKAILATAMSHDGRFVATGGKDYFVTVWDRLQERLHTRFYCEPIRCLDFLTNDYQLAIGLQNRKVEIYDIRDNGRAQLRRSVHAGHESGSIRSMAILQNPTRMVTISDDATVRFTRLNNPERKIGDLPAGVESAAISSDRTKFAFGHRGGLISVHNVMGHLASTTIPESQTFPTMHYHSDGQFAAAMPDEKQVRLIFGVCGQMPQETILPHTDVVRQACFSPDGKWLATVVGKQMLQIWKLPEGTAAREYAIPPLAEIFFSNDNETIVVLTSTREDAFLVDCMSGEIRQLSMPSADTTDIFHTVQSSPQGDYVAVASENGAVLLWDVRQQHLAKRLPVPGRTNALQFSNDGRILAVASKDVRLFDVTSGRHFMTFGRLPNPKEEYQSLLFTGHDDCLIAVRNLTGKATLQMWDTRPPSLSSSGQQQTAAAIKRMRSDRAPLMAPLFK